MLPALSAATRQIGVLERIFLDLRLDRNLGGELQEFANVGPRDIGHALQLLFAPEMVRVIELSQGVFVGVLFSDRVDHQPAARRQVFESSHNGHPRRRRIDDGVQLFRGFFRSVAGPRGTELAGKDAFGLGSGEDEHTRAGESMADHFQDEVGRGPETCQAQVLAIFQAGQPHWIDIRSRLRSKRGAASASVNTSGMRYANASGTVTSSA